MLAWEQDDNPRLRRLYLRASTSLPHGQGLSFGIQEEMSDGEQRFEVVAGSGDPRIDALCDRVFRFATLDEAKAFGEQWNAALDEVARYL